MAVTRTWALDRNFQPVTYVPPSGPVYDLVTAPLRGFCNQVFNDLFHTLLEPSPDRILPESGNWWCEAVRTAAFLKRYLGLLGGDPKEKLIEFTEFSCLSHQLEWRAITRDTYTSIEKPDQIAQATAIGLDHDP